MRDNTRRPGIYAPAALAAAAFVFILFSPSALCAQTSRTERETRRTEMQMRQWALRNLEKLKDAPPEMRHDTRPAYTDVEQDFEQLQLVNYTLAGAAAEGVALDYDLIKKHAAEVSKRASRLKTYLSLPEVEGSKTQAGAANMQTPEGLRTAVASLDALVNSFAWNPVFRQPNVVDLEQSSKASRDLAGIIALSEQIRKGAAELFKSTKREAKK
ncbi:MAG: hypothetical protein ACJ74Q_25250 [Pyrinomonadaceae bacterium]